MTRQNVQCQNVLQLDLTTLFYLRTRCLYLVLSFCHYSGMSPQIEALSHSLRKSCMQSTKQTLESKHPQPWNKFLVVPVVKKHKAKILHETLNTSNCDKS